MEYKRYARLVERARKGDDEAFAHIYMGFSQSTYYFCLKMLKNEDDAMDAFHEVMLGLYKNLNGIKNPQALVKYVNRSAYTKCVDFLKKKGRVREESYEEQGEYDQAEIDVNFIPEEYADREELRQAVVKMVESLADAQRAAVILYYYEQLEIKEIAEILDIDEYAVRNRLARARGALKRKYEEYEKTGTSAFMGVPVLTKILSSDAACELAQDDLRAMWEKLCTDTGLAPSILEAATRSAANLPITPVAIGQALAENAGRTFPLVGAAALLLAGAGAAGGIAYTISQRDTGPPIEGTSPTQVIEETVAHSRAEDGLTFEIILEEDIAPDGTGVDIEFAPEDEPADYPSVAEVPWEQASGAAVTGATTPVRGPEAEREEPETVFKEAVVSAALGELHYPAGTALSEATILADAGAWARNAEGAPTQILVRHLEEVDVDTPGKYAVYLEVWDGEPIWKVIFIYII